MLRFTDEPLHRVHHALAEALAAAPRVEAQIPDPDLSDRHFDGEPIEVAGRPCRYRSWAAWSELAQLLGAALMTPRPAAEGWVILRLRALDGASSWHQSARPAGDPEKYGADTEFARIDKFEDPSYLGAWARALRFIAPPPGARVLSLGCHTGAELGAAARFIERPQRLLGVDHSASAIAEARRRHPAAPFEFNVHDLAAAGIPEGRFDLIIAINVLHSPKLPGRALLKAIAKDHLTEGGGLLLGWPNCRYVDHRLAWGAVTRHGGGVELSVLLNDVMYHRRYLHQQRFQTRALGKHTLLLAARPLTSA